ncbi:ABC transporter permease [Nonomuraea sp. NN258]|uniref:ABC transporter permease n=1 Tax=Nonomuraea antri TaxID=2730852 RepID=UPI0015693961|nr:ABC transporter permease [Nonomuraea antri]NRQ35512.1 ABC transporter permease [Nonomuraea antri]
MRHELRAEWTKLRTTPGPAWLLVAIVVLTVSLSAAVSHYTTAQLPCPRTGCLQDVAKLSLSGVAVGQVAVALLAVSVLSAEYGTGLMRVTLAAMPRRGRVLAAKAVLVCGLTVAAGAPAVLGSLLAGRSLLPGNGFTPAHGFPPLSPADGSIVRAAVGSVLYLVLIGLLSLGVAAVVRDSAAAVGAVLGLLYILPVLMLIVGDEEWQRRLSRFSPMNAGLTVQSTAQLTELPLAPWAGLGVTAGWAGAALLAGWLALNRRDA